MSKYSVEDLKNMYNDACFSYGEIVVTFLQNDNYPNEAVNNVINYMNLLSKINVELNKTINKYNSNRSALLLLDDLNIMIINLNALIKSIDNVQGAVNEKIAKLELYKQLVIFSSYFLLKFATILSVGLI